jgi:membrane-bound metal-dependent hydrolase YbcI (DUF457 family)
MDPVSHVIIGRTIVAALDTNDRDRFGRGAACAAMLGALSPDVDCLLMPAGWDIYLRFHEVGTHSLPGGILLGCAVAVLVRLFVRGSRLAWLAAAGMLGASSHLALDVMSGARLGLWWPFASGRSTWPLVAMAEPWLICVLAAGAVAMWAARRHLRRAARLLLIAVAVCLGARAALYSHVREIAERDLGVDHTAPQAIEARWGAWTKWDVFERDPQRLRTWEVDGWSGKLDLILSWPLQAETPTVAASRSLGTVKNFLDVHDLAFARERADSDGRRVVQWSDARYCRQASPGAAEIDCGLWFGGTFEAGQPVGRALSQEVHVGGWMQMRPVSP